LEAVAACPKIFMGLALVHFQNETQNLGKAQALGALVGVAALSNKQLLSQ
jgi:hypothetical protein